MDPRLSSLASFRVWLLALCVAGIALAFGAPHGLAQDAGEGNNGSATDAPGEADNNNDDVDDGDNGESATEAPPTGPGRITGTVEREDGAAMSARVELVRMPDGGADFAAETESEPELGEFAFEDLPLGAYSLYASVPGYEMVIAEVTLEADDDNDGAPEVELALVIPLPQGSLLVRALHEPGVPVERGLFYVSATVQPRPIAVPGAPRGIPTVAFDERGEALVPISTRSREAMITVHTQAGAVFAGASVQLDPEALWVHEIAVPRPITVSIESVPLERRDDRVAPADVPPGLLLDQAGNVGGEPHFGYIAATPEGGYAEPGGRPGRFRLLLPPGEFELRVTSESFVDAHQTIRLEAGESPRDVQLVPQRGPQVRVRAVDGATGEPVEGARLAMGRAGAARPIVAETMSRSGEDGWIHGGAFTRATAQNRNAWVHAEGYQPARVDWVAHRHGSDDDTDDAAVQLFVVELTPLPEPPRQPYGRLDGVLVHDATDSEGELSSFAVTGIILVPRARGGGQVPSPGTQFSALESETHFRVDGIEPGEYDAVLFADGQFAYLTTPDDPVVIEANEKLRRRLSFTTIERTVQLEDVQREAVAGATLHFEGTRRVRTDEHGSVTLSLVVPRSRPDWLRMQIAHPQTGERRHFQLFVEPGIAAEEVEPIRLNWDEPDVGDAQLVIEARDGETGEVIEATVNIVRISNGRLVRHIARASESHYTDDGEARQAFRYLPRGRYAIYVQADGYKLAERIPGQTRGPLSLEHGGSQLTRVTLNRAE